MIINKIFLFLIYISSMLILCNCDNKNVIKENKVIYLRILNSEDYIYKQIKNENEKDLIIQFEDYMQTKGKTVKVIYDTFDTQEDVLNILKSNKKKYDLVCISDYMIQKFIKSDLIIPFDKYKIPNYYDMNSTHHCSNFVYQKLSMINIKNNNFNDYALCYMWGTVGITYNPNYYKFKKRGIKTFEIIKDMNDWNSLWNKKYKNAISIKNSIRDVFFIGLLNVFKKQIENANYNEKNVIFNYGNEKDKNAKDHIEIVKKKIIQLKKNIYGFECDSGKEDIVTEKIGINLSWSGDAIYSIKKAKKEKNLDLYYSIPTTGTNLWFDCWVMLKNADVNLSSEFLNFISDSKNAIKNMEYTGFTSAIISDDIFNYFKQKYNNNVGNYKYDLTYFFIKNKFDKNKYIFNISENDKNKQIVAQFPEEKKINSLMIIEDYGLNNNLLLKMWIDFKIAGFSKYIIFILFLEFFIISYFIFFIKKKVF